MAGRVLCCTVALLASLGVPAGSAHAAGPETAAPSCSDGNLAAASVSGTPTSVKAGAAVVDSTRLTNTTAATLSNASFILALLPPPGVNGGSGTPQLSWRVDGGSWHAFGLTWTTPSGSDADWQSQVQYFGATFAPKASRTLDIRTEFTTASPNGEYQYDLAYSADPCSMSELGMNFEDSQYAQGWTQPRPQPSPTTRKPTAPRTSAAAVTTMTPAYPKTATASPSPTLSPSPTVSPSASPTPTAAATSAAAIPATLTAAQPAASSKSNHAPMFVFVALAALVLLGGGLYAGRRSHNRS